MAWWNRRVRQGMGAAGQPGGKRGGGSGAVHRSAALQPAVALLPVSSNMLEQRHVRPACKARSARSHLRRALPRQAQQAAAPNVQVHNFAAREVGLRTAGKVMLAYDSQVGPAAVSCCNAVQHAVGLGTCTPRPLHQSQASQGSLAWGSNHIACSTFTRP